MATRIKYDVSDVEPGRDSGDPPQPGLYAATVASVTHRDKKSNGDPTNDLEVVLDLGAKYSRLWTYVQLDNPATAWKLRELTDALGMPPKGTLDIKAMEGKKVSVRVKADKDLEGNYRGSVKNLLKPGSEEDDGDGDAPAGAGQYDDWDDDDLKAELEERGLKVSGRFSTQKAIDLLEESDDDAEGKTGGADDADAPTDDYDEWTLEDLKTEADERELKISGRKTTEKLIEALRANDVESGQGEGEPAATEDDYDDWELDELKAEVKERDLETPKGRLSKDKLIEVLRADDKEDLFNNK